MRAFTIHIYNPNTNTHALLNWVDYSSGNYSQGFCCLARFLSSAFTALACQQPHLARAANPELWWGGVSYLFGRAQTDLWIGAQKRGERKAGGEGEWPSWHVSGWRSNLPPSSSSPPSFLLSLTGCSFCSTPFILNSPRHPLSLKRRPRQHRLAADYQCNHSHFRWSDRRKGLQIILTPSWIHPNSCWRQPTTATLFLPSIFCFLNSRPENSPRKAQLKQWPSKPILPISSAQFGVM